MLCIHQELENSHTFSENCITYYCVYCAWDLIKQNKCPLVNISLDKIPKKEDITFEEYSMTEIIKGLDIFKYPESDHVKRIKNSDLSYPIILIETGQKYIIFDGCHRRMKMDDDNNTNVNCYVLNLSLLKPIK